MIVPTNDDAKEDVNATLVDEERQSTSPETAATLMKNPSDDESSDARGSDSSPTNTVNLDDLRKNCFFLFPDLKRRLSRFWILMILSVIIATSGVAGNSAATVIGAMIVAPLMMPILGTMLGIVLGDKNNFAFSFLMVILGGGSAILISYLYGLGLQADTILSENNDQIANRVQPKLTDLIAALATGAVASIALVRKDIADTLPGVAIAISLVPPLCVVGLTLSTGNGHEAIGAFLLFATNVASILVLGVIVMYFYRVHLMVGSRDRKPVKPLTVVLVLVALLALVAVPLGFTSQRIRDMNRIENCLEASAHEWADPQGWKVSFVIATGSPNDYSAKVFVTGTPPFPTKNDFPEDASACGVEIIEIAFVPIRSIEL